MALSVFQLLKNGDIMGAFHALLANVPIKQEDGSYPVQGNLFTPEQDLSYASTLTLDLSTGCAFSVTLTGNVTFANPTNAKDGTTGYIVVTQGGAGSNLASWGSDFRVQSSGDLVLSTAVGAVDILTYLVSGGKVYISKSADWVAV